MKQILAILVAATLLSSCANRTETTTTNSVDSAKVIVDSNSAVIDTTAVADTTK